MKRTSLFVIAFLFGINLFSQSTYYAFPDSNAVWLESHQYGGSFPCVQNWDREIYISKDTIIGGSVYKKLLFDEHDYVSWYPGCGSNNNYYTIGNLYGFYRNDTVNRRVYIKKYIFNYSSTDSLLYDFSKLQGDTVNSIMGRYKIDSIKNIFIDNSYRRKFFVNYFASASPSTSGTTQIIEGIGSFQGLVTFPDDWEGSDMLQCFSENGKKLYPDTNGVCQHILSVTNAEKPETKIYPNPANNKIYFTGINSGRVRIIDLTGRIVVEEKLIGNSVDVSNLKDGVYFIEMNEEEKYLFTKVLIAR